MSDFVLELIPQLEGHDVFLIVVSAIFCLYFGGMIFQLIGGLFGFGKRRY